MLLFCCLHRAQTCYLCRWLQLNFQLIAQFALIFIVGLNMNLNDANCHVSLLLVKYYSMLDGKVKLAS